MGELEGKHAVLTGGANGIGRVLAARFVELGATVLVADRDEERLASLREEAGERLLTTTCDLLSSASIATMMDEALARLGRIDILANVAGGSGKSAWFATEEGKAHHLVEELPEAEWDFCLDLNLKHPFLTIQRVIPHMKARGHGRIVNFSSIASYSGISDDRGAYAAYAAAKAGVEGLTRQLARALGPHGITVNAVCPGGVATDLILQRIRENEERGLPRPDMSQLNPFGRLATPEEVVDAVCFLASDRARFLTGVVLDVNGGQYMRG